METRRCIVKIALAALIVSQGCAMEHSNRTPPDVTLPQAEAPRVENVQERTIKEAETPRRAPGDLLALIKGCKHERARCTVERVVRFIEEGADPRAEDVSGNTPLRLAVAYGLEAAAVAALVDAGADASSSELLALAAPRVDVMRILLDAGTPVDGPASPFSGTGATPLMSFVYGAGSGPEERIFEALRCFLEAGADPYHETPDGETAFSALEQAIRKDEEYLAKTYPDGGSPGYREARIALKQKILAALRDAPRPNVAPSPSAARKSSPPLPFVDRGVYPRSYGRWIADERTAVYASEGDTSHTVFTLERDDGFDAETGSVWARKAGVVRIDRAVALTVLDVAEQETLSLDAGEHLTLLAYLGDGRNRVWWNGRPYLVKTCWTTPYSSGPDPCGVQVEPPETEWWIRVRDDRGRGGWIVRALIR